MSKLTVDEIRELIDEELDEDMSSDIIDSLFELSMICYNQFLNKEKRIENGGSEHIQTLC